MMAYRFVSVRKGVLSKCFLEICQGYKTLSLQPRCTQILLSHTRSMCTQIPLDPESKRPLYDPKKGDLVYAGKISKIVFQCKCLSLTTCIVGAVCQPYFLMQAGTMSKVVLTAAMGSVAFFMFVTTGIIQVITKRYLTDIYFNKDTKTFTAGRYTFFLRRKNVEYTAEDVVVPDIPGLFTTVKIKGTPYFFDEQSFKDYDAFIHMVGYDKPLDLSKYKKDIDQHIKEEIHEEKKQHVQ